MCVARHGWVAFGFRGGLAAEWIKLYVFDALNIHHVLMQLYIFSGKGSLHSLFTVGPFFRAEIAEEHCPGCPPQV